MNWKLEKNYEEKHHSYHIIMNFCFLKNRSKNKNMSKNKLGVLKIFFRSILVLDTKLYHHYTFKSQNFGLGALNMLIMY